MLNVGETGDKVYGNSTLLTYFVDVKLFSKIKFIKKSLSVHLKKE